MKEKQLIAAYFKKLGLDQELAGLFIELTKLGQSSALLLAKVTGVTRTQVYRHLETVASKGLVSSEQLSYGTLYRALPIENVEGLLADREAETALLRGNIKAVASALHVIVGSTGKKAVVRHYYGVAGLKQANWNLTHANGEYRVFEQAHISQHLDKAFARRHRQRCIEKGITSYDLTNATDVTAKDIEPYNPDKTFIRHIDREVLDISFEMFVYNDIVTLIDHSPDQQMAIEIEHPALRAMMRQLFDAMWKLAKPLKIS